MFDMGSLELLFCAGLALVLMGPKEIPGIVRTLTDFIRRMRRMSRSVADGVARLEREVGLASGEASNANAWLDFVPEEVRAMRRQLKPHGDPEKTKAAYQAYRAALDEARAAYQASMADADPDADSNEEKIARPIAASGAGGRE